MKVIIGFKSGLTKEFRGEEISVEKSRITNDVLGVTIKECKPKFLFLDLEQIDFITRED